MRFDAYYVCRGKPALLNNKGLDPDLIEILAEPKLFKHSEGGITAWSWHHYEIEIKLLILCYFKQQYESDEFLVSAPVSLDFFDQWWTLERFFSLENDLDVILDNLPAELISAFVPTGNDLVDSWIRGLKDVNKDR